MGIKGIENLFEEEPRPHGDQHKFVAYQNDRYPNSCVRCGKIKDDPVHIKETNVESK